MRLGSTHPSPIPSRFAFGIPLEDVFSTCQVHPRLQNLLAKTLQTYREQEGDIEWVLRCGQGSVEERLALKNQLVLSSHGQMEGSAPGVYLWVIRHFLGLLPLPLFPSFTKGTKFDWLPLSTECRRAFKCHYLARDSLDTAIARLINALPEENLRLIKMLMCFLRRLAAKRTREGKAKLSRASLRALSCYFCGALFVRPFWPGGEEQNRFQPLLLYLIVRWHKIDIYCTATDHHLECFKPIYPANTCVKEIGCQTLSKDLNPAEQTINELYKLAFVGDDCANLETHFYTAQDFSFRSLLEEEKSQSWHSILEETKLTVQKVEDAYIYDDYESFKREEFNQIGKPGSLLSRFMSVKASTPKNQSSESDSSYIKFPDVCSSSCENVIKTCDDKTVGQQLFEDNSPAAVQSSDSQTPLHSPGENTGPFRKISLHIIRALRPKTGAFQRQLRYMRIRTEEANNF